MHNNISILSFFWKHIKPYKWHYLVMLLAPIINSFYPFIYNYIIKMFLDMIGSGIPLTFHSLWVPGTLFLTTQLVLDATWRLSNIAEWRSEPFVRRSIILDSYQYVLHHSYSFFQNTHTGSISSKLKGILDGYDTFWGEIHHGLGTKLLQIVVSIGALMLINRNLSIFIWFWSLFYISIMYVLSKRLNHLAHQETEGRHYLFGLVADTITNIITLLSYASRKREVKRLDTSIQEILIPRQIKVYKCNFMLQLVAGIFYLIMFSFIMFYMIYLKKHNLITIGDFAFVFSMALSISDDIWHSTIYLQDFTRYMGDLKSSLSILAIPQENLDIKDAYPLTIQKPTIEFKSINFSYDGTAVFKDLNLTIQPGEKIGLVGHSGAGKSSLVNLLLRYFSPDSGHIFIDGHNIANVTQESLRNHIAVIPQDTMLFHRSLMENIRYGNPAASKAQVIEASKKAHIHDFILTLPEGYDAFVGERGIKLSGGQRQRISIDRAILKDAPVLVLDEATSSLDSKTEKLIQESLNFFIEDKQKTVIAIAHRLSTLKHMDRILVLDKGAIVEQGTHSELVSKPESVYKTLWEYQG